MNARLSVVVAFLSTLALWGALACSPSAQNPPGENVVPVDENPAGQTSTDTNGGTDAQGTDPTGAADQGTGNGDTGTADGDGANAGKLTFTMRADFSASAVGANELSGDPTRTAGCSDPPPTQDHPGEPAGSDCDGDGATVQYITPSQFRVAVKQLVLIDDQGGKVEIVPEAGQLAAANVIDLTAPATLADAAVPAGHYTQIHAVFYYYELVMPLNNPPADQGLRLYLSDDDFPDQGSLGHHQGDITLVDPNGAELGFVVEGAPWTVAALSPQHQDMVYAGSTDAETGHRRGPFGDTALWDAERFVQGPAQDLFLFDAVIDLNLTSTGAAITVVFNVGNSWYYEDFENDGVFAPCGNGQGNPGDACFEGGGWAAVFPLPRVLLAPAPAEIATASGIK